ncbi:glutamine transport system permease protein GlnP [Rhodoferax lithotrophicus]|uniref:Glutamine transport system permease protein GlnP n=1 Tax=Rhodoferax lithotrophicus TaxID=2798804 RepID=A0ABN6D8U5_9BURK|nr:amino acid ABC transporter permease [Rhodoferax sp. MIZ03]BCO28410.1 glutamine transport system permease protein GlnP [Rhodoferax sp. MIZ03]
MDRRWIWGWIDTSLLVLLIGVLTYVAWRTQAVLQYHWDWSQVWPYVLRFDVESASWVPNLIVEGLLTTLRLALWGILVASGVGLCMALARTSNNLFLRMIATAYVLLIRNIPPVVFVFVFVYFIASQVMPFLHFGDSIATLPTQVQTVISVLFAPAQAFDNFFLGLFCLSVFSGAYVTEIFRAGLQSIPKSQIEAGESLGFSRWDNLRYVVIPQALHNVLPPLAGQFIQLIKDSSLVSLVSIQELAFMAQDVQVSTQKVFEVFVLTAVIYFVLCFCLSQLFAFLERHGKRGQKA